MNPSQDIDVSFYKKKTSILASSPQIYGIRLAFKNQNNIRASYVHNLTSFNLDFENLHNEDDNTLIKISKDSCFFFI